MIEMDIRLTEVGGSKKSFTFPANPERIRGTFGTKYQSFDILSKGSRKIPKGTEVSEIRWDGEFFGTSKKKEAIVKQKVYQDPNFCLTLLQEWQRKGTILNLIISNTWINMDVTISSFTPEVYGAYGNIKYSISLVQYQDLKIYTTQELNSTSATKKTVSRNEPKTTDTSHYTVVSGDTLWGIAIKKLGSSKKWTKIYETNIKTIEAAAKSHGKASSDHGHWIYPGTILSLPS